MSTLALPTDIPGWQLVNRVAETHFFVRPYLRNCLHKYSLTDEGKRLIGTEHDSYRNLWDASGGQAFADMTTLVRLGSAIEVGLRNFYMQYEGHLTLADLAVDPDVSTGVFQRLMPWTNNNAMDLYRSRVGVDLSTISQFSEVQRSMLCRHLYAHSGGVVDKDWADKYQRLTGTDVRALPDFTNFATRDVIWLDPLDDLPQLIEDCKRFFRAAPFFQGPTPLPGSAATT